MPVVLDGMEQMYVVSIVIPPTLLGGAREGQSR